MLAGVTKVEAEWPYKLLDRNRHARLVENIDAITSIAGVPAQMLDRSMVECGCSAEEADWVRAFPSLAFSERHGGLLLLGSFHPAPEVRLMAMGAAFLRNFVDARIVSTSSLFPDDGEDPVNPTVLVVPDFFRISSTGSHSLMNWQVRYLNGYLMERYSMRRATVLHIEDLKGFNKEFGKSFGDFLYGSWDVLQGQQV